MARVAHGLMGNGLTALLMGMALALIKGDSAPLRIMIALALGAATVVMANALMFSLRARRLSAAELSASAALAAAYLYLAVKWPLEVLPPALLLAITAALSYGTSAVAWSNVIGSAALSAMLAAWGAVAGLSPGLAWPAALTMASLSAALALGVERRLRRTRMGAQAAFVIALVVASAAVDVALRASTLAPALLLPLLVALRPGKPVSGPELRRLGRRSLAVSLSFAALTVALLSLA